MIRRNTSMSKLKKEVGFDFTASSFGMSVVFATVENTSTAAISANYKYRYEY